VRGIGAIVLVLGLLARAAGAVGTGQGLALHYEIYYLAFPVISLDVTATRERATYRTTAELHTEGLLAAFASWSSTADVGGLIDGPLLRPTLYRVKSAYGDRRQRIEVDYDGGAVRDDVDGVLTDGERETVPDALKEGTVDPLTAATAVADRLASTGTCAGPVRVFDGLRRYDLLYDDLGDVELERSTRDPYRGSARHCRARIEPIAGFLRTGERAGERATALSTWLAPPLPGLRPIAVRMDLEGHRGTLHVHLARATPGF
jgi:hypothetical protein